MAVNFPGPYEIRLKYNTVVSGVTLVHTQRLSCAVAGDDPGVGQAFSAIDVGRRVGGAIALSTAVNNYVNLMKVFYSNVSGNVIVSAELWKYIAGTFDASFVSAYPIDVAGTSASAIQAAGQSIVTMRSTNGGVTWEPGVQLYAEADGSAKDSRAAPRDGEGRTANDGAIPQASDEAAKSPAPTRRTTDVATCRTTNAPRWSGRPASARARSSSGRSCPARAARATCSRARGASARSSAPRTPSASRRARRRRRSS